VCVARTFLKAVLVHIERAEREPAPVQWHLLAEPLLLVAQVGGLERVDLLLHELVARLGGDLLVLLVLLLLLLVHPGVVLLLAHVGRVIY
jgi:hypothetical protein